MVPNLVAGSSIILMPLLMPGIYGVSSAFADHHTETSFHTVSGNSLVTAMEKAASSAYDPTATTNGIRYHADVIINLLKAGGIEHREESAEPVRLSISHKDWYEVFKLVNCQDRAIPEYIELAHRYRQDIFVEYGPHIIKKVKHGGVPKLAANVSMCWPPELVCCRRNTLT